MKVKLGNPEERRLHSHGPRLCGQDQGRLPATSVKVKGTIFPGDLLSVKEKPGAKIVVDITDDAKIERNHGNVELFRFAPRIWTSQP